MSKKMDELSLASPKKDVSMKYHKDSILCRLRYAEENNELYEGEIEEIYAGRTNYYNLNPDPRIEGYGKMTYPDGKTVMGYWSRGKALRYITVRPNGKRDFVAMNTDSYTYNQVYFSKDHKFIPGGQRKNNTNNWSDHVLNDIIEIEEIIARQQEYLKDKPVLTTKMGDGWFMDTMVSTLLKESSPKKSTPQKAQSPSVSIGRMESSPDGRSSVVLEKAGDQPLMTTRLLMEALGIGLAAAKKLVDKAPSTVMAEVDESKAIALMKELEALGNTVSIPGMETKTTPAATKKTVGTKKTTAKKSTPSPLTVAAPSSGEFDAIFGATSPSSSAPKAKAKSGSKATVSKATAAENDAFDAIFGSTAPKTVTKSQAEKTVAQSDLVKALAKALEIVGKDDFINGDRVCNLLGDLVPKLEKERRRIKIAYSANAVAALINEADKTFAVSEAAKRMVDYSDMAERIAKETILAIYEVLK